MTLFEFPFWRIWGMNGVAEWQSNWIIISKLTRGNSSKVWEPRISWTISLHLWHGVVCNAQIGRVDVPEPPELNETLLELKLSRGPLGEQTAERDTVPVNPAMLAMLTVTVPLAPAAKLRDDGFTLRVKS